MNPRGEGSAGGPGLGVPEREPAGLGGLGTRGAARELLRRPGRLVWLWVVWMVLWGSLTPLAAISGLLVSAVALLAFPLRGGDPEVRFRPLPALFLTGRLLADLVPSALAVALQMIRYGPRTRSAIVEVPLTGSSEVVSTLTANAISLAPGAFVLEIDHEAGVMYVCVLAADDDGMTDRVRASVLDVHRRVQNVFGSDEDIRRQAGQAGRRGGEEQT
ncbi:Na+/H+ antiporter subunit E [Frankia sp. Cpl3]|uniref:Na+/H+ antiporter subunit E n=1 Tax=Parafrankia colletiae TaxID=573497 RepID=UPI000A951DC4|nr:Na+/H+ antiporter subunit E [Parafrankia colletiae]MCK9900871.1 Na+/H+ antiporter subunit E [Frankia sp. Cpl3]